MIPHSLSTPQHSSKPCTRRSRLGSAAQLFFLGKLGEGGKAVFLAIDNFGRAHLAGLSASFFEMRQKSHRLSSCQAVLATSRPARASVPLTKLQAVLAPHPCLASPRL